ncbi:MAG: LysR family transcriptional regulator [Pikeienuella sp.]
MPTNIPTDLLRSFVTVVDLGGFTRAADALGRTQPAISLQIKRLEDLLGAKLFQTTRRQFSLTDAGVALGPYARQMLRLNDDTVAYFSDAAPSGTLRVGVPTDFSHNFLLTAIADFGASFPDVKIEIESMSSRELRDLLAEQALDIVAAIVPDEDVPYLVTSTVVKPFWVMKDSFTLEPKAAVPLLRHPEPCEYAQRMYDALRVVGRSWRTMLVSRDVAGLQAGILAGAGVTALTPATLLPGMRVARADEGFPPLAAVRIGLFYKHSALTEAGHALAGQLLEQIRRAEEAS